MLKKIKGMFKSITETVPRQQASKQLSDMLDLLLCDKAVEAMLLHAYKQSGGAGMELRRAERYEKAPCDLHFYHLPWLLQQPQELRVLIIDQSSQYYDELAQQVESKGWIIFPGHEKYLYLNAAGTQWQWISYDDLKQDGGVHYQLPLPYGYVDKMYYPESYTDWFEEWQRVYLDAQLDEETLLGRRSGTSEWQDIHDTLKLILSKLLKNDQLCNILLDLLVADGKGGIALEVTKGAKEYELYIYLPRDFESVLTSRRDCMTLYIPWDLNYGMEGDTDLWWYNLAEHRGAWKVWAQGKALAYTESYEKSEHGPGGTSQYYTWEIEHLSAIGTERYELFEERRRKSFGMLCTNAFTVYLYDQGGRHKQLMRQSNRRRIEGD